MSTENGQASAPSASHCYAIFPDGVYEGIEHFRYQFGPGCAELVNFEFTLPNGYQWRGSLQARYIFEDRESARSEWDRRFA
jgi:hypothetical protein